MTHWHSSTLKNCYCVEFSRENFAYGVEHFSKNNITMNLAKIAYCVYGKILGNFSSEIFAVGICLDTFTRTNAQQVSSQRKSRKRRKSSLTVATMADDKVDWLPTTDINTPLGILLLIDRNGDRRTAGQLVDDRNVIICGAGMDATAPFHHYPPPWHPPMPTSPLHPANPPSGLTIRAGC